MKKYSWIVAGAVAAAIVFIAALASSGCGARAQGLPRAVEIDSPVGVNCFAILNEVGQTVGGNCLYIR